MTWKSVYVVGGLRIHLATKNASQSLRHAIPSTVPRAFPMDPGPEPRFMVVRHPLDRLVAIWRFMCFAWARRYEGGAQVHPDTGEYPASYTAMGYRPRMSFADFLRVWAEYHRGDMHTQSQTHYAGLVNPAVDTVVRLSSLPAHWAVLQTAHPSLRPLPHINVTAHGSWCLYYTPDQRRLATKVLSSDMDLYDAAV